MGLDLKVLLANYSVPTCIYGLGFRVSSLGFRV